MEANGQTSRSVLLFSLVVMILPLVAFPARFGTELARASLVNALYELAYYGLVVWLFHRQASLWKVIEGAGVCLIYRLIVGAVFGLLVAAMYTMGVGVALSLGLSGYLPAILIQVALAPFILKPVVASLIAPEESVRRNVRRPRSLEAGETGRTSIAISKQRGVVTQDTALEPTPPTEPDMVTGESFGADTGGLKTGSDLNGFDKAVGYIGEHGSVKLAIVVDDEGLLLANFMRGQTEAEVIAPQALRFLEGSREFLDRCNLDGLEKLDLLLDADRLVVAVSDGYCLVVLSERHDDDLLSIRINQGIDMINRFVAERYGDKLNSNAERIHVSSAQ